MDQEEDRPLDNAQNFARMLAVAQANCLEKTAKVLVLNTSEVLVYTERSEVRFLPK